MYNQRFDLLSDYPFDRLRSLLDHIQPPSGVEPVAMSIGEPRHAPPAFVRETLDANAALWGSYPPTTGTEDFRAAVAEWLDRRYALPERMVDPDRHILPVAGTREALFLIANLVLPRRKAGGRTAVLIPNPFYQVYVGATMMAGAEPIYIPSTRRSGHLPDFDLLDPTVLRRTTMDADVLDRAGLAYLCTPANPQGAVADIDYLKRAVALARKHNFVLAVDECYSEIYDRSAPPGALAACAAMGGDLSNVLVFHSLSKRSSVPGLRSGFVAGDADLIAGFTRLRAYGGAATPLPVLAAAAALWRDEAHVEHNRTLYRAKMDAAERILGGRFGFSRPAGTFFLWLNVGDGEDAAVKLWTEAAIRVLPGAYLARSDTTGQNPGRNFIRVALVHDLETTTRALERIRAVLG